MGSTREIDGDKIKQLVAQGFSEGLAKSLNGVKNSFPVRIWVVDNSGSMGMTDGHRIIPSNGTQDVKIVSCTRWKEIQESVNYHINLSGLISLPTSFRLLNN